LPWKHAKKLGKISYGPSNRSKNLKPKIFCIFTVSAQTPTVELPEDAAIANVRRQAEILLGENALNGCWNLLARCFPAELFIRLKLTLSRQLKHEAAKYVPTSQP
jgi:hypothetical protein